MTGNMNLRFWLTMVTGCHWRGGVNFFVYLVFLGYTMSFFFKLDLFYEVLDKQSIAC